MPTVRARYLNDPVYHQVVDALRDLIRQARLTPSEVREAAMLACILEDELRPAVRTTSDEEMEALRRRL
jgi:hypothetical protein